MTDKLCVLLFSSLLFLAEMLLRGRRFYRSKTKSQRDHPGHRSQDQRGPGSSSGAVSSSLCGAFPLSKGRGLLGDVVTLCHPEEQEGALALSSYRDSLSAGRGALTPSRTFPRSDGHSPLPPWLCQASHRHGESAFSSQAWPPVNSRKADCAVLPQMGWLEAWSEAGRHDCRSLQVWGTTGWCWGAPGHGGRLQ